MSKQEKVKKEVMGRLRGTLCANCGQEIDVFPAPEKMCIKCITATLRGAQATEILNESIMKAHRKKYSR